MSDPYENSINDLFDFPEVEGLEEFGLVPPVPAGMVRPDPEVQPEVQQQTQPEAQAEAPAAPVETAQAAEAPAPAPAPAAAATPPPVQATAPTSGNARPNPPVPSDVTDLDEDLFGFDELFSLDDDPYHNGTLSSDGLPANDLFLDPTEAAAPAPAPDAAQAPAAQAQPEAPAPAPAPVQEHAPTAPQATQPPPPAAAQPQPQPSPAAPAAAASEPVHQAPQPQAATLPSSFPAETPGNEHMSAPNGAGAGHMLRDRGPRILLPEDIPYSQSSEKQRLLWILVACFLLVNTGIFYVAHQASAAFHSSLQATTDKLADAIAQDKAAPAAVAPSFSDETSASVDLEPALTHTVTQRPDYDAATSLPERSKRDRWIDPRDYANTHEFAVGNAKALLAEGRFEDARRLLNHVLANQGRIPLSPVLREEIDYLIPLTYFEHGNATAPTREESL